jgi:hypothetical protein
MENPLKKGKVVIVDQLHAIRSFKTHSQPIHPHMKLFLSKHQSIFEPPQGIPPSL